MDFLLAKVKGIQSPFHYKILSDQTVFKFDLDQYDLLEYEPSHNLDENGLFKVSRFSEAVFYLEFLTTIKDKTSADYNQIPLGKFKEIQYLCSVQRDAICFQKVTSSTYLKRRILKLGENAQLENNENSILINSFPDAVYIPNKDILVFRNLGTISSIFNGIDTLYKEATNLDVESFLAAHFIDLDNEYNAEKVSKPNRKRIGLAVEALKQLDKLQKIQMLDYIHGYCDDIKYDAAKNIFSISSDKELKILLYGIDQRFYTTMIGKEKRLANSIQLLG